MPLWTIALGLMILILLPRILLGQTPQEQESDEWSRSRTSRRRGFRDDRPVRSTVWVHRP